MTYLFRIIILFLNQLVHSMYIVLTQYRTRSTIRSTYTPLIPAPFSLWTRSKERNSATHARSHSNPPITKNPAQYETSDLSDPLTILHTRTVEKEFSIRISPFRSFDWSNDPIPPPSPLSIFVGEHRNTFSTYPPRSFYRAYICIRCSEHCQDRPRGQ